MRAASSFGKLPFVLIALRSCRVQRLDRAALLFALVAPLTLSIPMLGHPFFLTTFLANADDRTERHLSRAPSAPRIVVTRLIFLGIALFAPLALPKTSSGKIQHSRLVQMIQDDSIGERVVYGDDD